MRKDYPYIDMRGVNIITAEKGSNTARFSLGQLAAGMYMLQISAGDGFKKNIKFVK